MELVTKAVLAAPLILVLYHVVKALGRFFRDRQVLSPIPLAPNCNWLLGHVIPLAKREDPWHLLKEWLYNVSPDPIVRFRILGWNGVIVRDPHSMKQVFQTHMKSYPKDNFSLEPFLCILGTGLVTSEGQLWQQQRLLMAPALRVEILSDVVRIAKEAADRLTEKLEKVRGTGVAIDMQEEFRLLTLQVIGQAILSLPPDECDRVFPELYLPVMEENNIRTMRRWRMYFPSPDWFRHRSKVKQLDNYIIQLLRTRWRKRKGGPKAEKGDILDRIMGALEDKGEEWSVAMETQLCFEIKTFLLAGHETSAAMLSWALHELIQNPRCMQEVQKEAEQVFGAKESLPERSAVDGMQYTLSTLKESLRKYTVVPVVTRKVGVQQLELCGHKLPKGTKVVLSLQGVHDLYKDPTRFDPTRFMPGGEYEQFDEAIRPFMFVPFVQGPRNCLGQHFSLLETRVVLSLLVKRFKFTPVRKGEPRRSLIIPECIRDGLQMLIE